VVDHRSGSPSAWLKAFSGKYGAGAPDALRELNGILKSADSRRPPLMLRRMKEAILEGLPEKQTLTHPVDMPPIQWRAYDAVIAAAHADVSVDGPAYRGRMLEIVQRLRAVSLHPNPNEKDDMSFIANSARLVKTMEVLSDIARILATDSTRLSHCNQGQTCSPGRHRLRGKPELG
jgi:hypothetical protein